MPEWNEAMRTPTRSEQYWNHCRPQTTVNSPCHSISIEETYTTNKPSYEQFLRDDDMKSARTEIVFSVCGLSGGHVPALTTHEHVVPESSHTIQNYTWHTQIHIYLHVLTTFGLCCVIRTMWLSYRVQWVAIFVTLVSVWSWRCDGSTDTDTDCHIEVQINTKHLTHGRHGRASGWQTIVRTHSSVLPAGTL